jgi:hypothetical protein
MEIDLDARYTVRHWGDGIAFYVLGPVMVWNEDSEWSGIEEPHESLVRAVMVGDDKVHHVDIDDLVLLDDDAYCHECGQVGCTADGRE